MSTADFSKHWKSHRHAYKEALNYLSKRRKGALQSFITPWHKVNDAGVNGIEWKSMVVIGGRPGSGKTLGKDQIIREAYKRNKGVPMRVLEFQFEMVARASKIREFSSVLGKPYKYICSAYEDDKLSESDIKELHEHAKGMTSEESYPIDIVETPVTVKTFIKIVESYMEKHAQTIEGKKVYTDTVITADHSLLFVQERGQSKTDMLYELGEAVTKLKRKYPIIAIILSQLGRHVESPERNENGKYGNYILETDIFGGDALLQHADMVIGINRPGQKFIKHYGPEKFIIADDNVLVFHFLKCRSGDTRMSFMRAAFDRMEIQEMETPERYSRISTS